MFPKSAGHDASDIPSNNFCGLKSYNVMNFFVSMHDNSNLMRSCRNHNNGRGCILSKAIYLYVVFLGLLFIQFALVDDKRFFNK